MLRKHCTSHSVLVMVQCRDGCAESCTYLDVRPQTPSSLCCADYALNPNADDDGKERGANALSPIPDTNASEGKILGNLSAGGEIDLLGVGRSVGRASRERAFKVRCATELNFNPQVARRAIHSFRTYTQISECKSGQRKAPILSSVFLWSWIELPGQKLLHRVAVSVILVCVGLEN